MDVLEELRRRIDECAKLVVLAPTAALRQQYAELTKAWEDLLRDRFAASGRDGEGLFAGERDD